MLNSINSPNSKTDLFSQMVENKDVAQSAKLLSGKTGGLSFKQNMKDQAQKFSADDKRLDKATTEKNVTMESKVSQPVQETKEGGPPGKAERPDDVAPQKARGSPGAKRQKVFQEFMDSIESELGIDPARFAEAMAKAGTLDQRSSPEEVADAVIDNLEVSADKKGTAKEMYMGFLFALNQAEKPPEVKNLVLGDAMIAQPQEVLRRFQSTQEQKQQLNASLDQLNQKFWNKDVSPGKPQAIPTSAQISQDQLIQKMQALRESTSLQAAPEMPANLMDQMQRPSATTAPLTMGYEDQQKLLNEVAARQKFVEWMAQSQVQMDAKAVDGKLSQPQASTDAQIAMLMAQQGNPDLPGAGQSSKLPKVLMNDETYTAPGMKMQNVGNGALFGSLPQVNANSSTADLTDSLEQDAGQSTDDGRGSTDLGSTPTPLNSDLGLNAHRPASFFPPTAAMAPTTNMAAMNDKNEAIQNILNQAKFLAQKGGGEMNVQMTPEGLGKVNLKVMMTDGKLHVQMSADNPEVKSLIESNISDLKHQLHSQKLSVENVKVDYVQGTNTDNSAQQTLTNQNFQQREGAKQFWNQFQDSFGNRSQRDGYFEFVNAKPYATQDKDPLTPISSNSTRRFESKGRGLNLVA